MIRPNSGLEQYQNAVAPRGMRNSKLELFISLVLLKG